MRSERLYDALTELEEEMIDEAARPPARQPQKRRRLRWMGALAAVLALALLLTAVLRRPDGGLTVYALETPTYPAAVPYPDFSGLLSGKEVDSEALQAAYDAWHGNQQLRLGAARSYSTEEFRPYLEAVIPAFLGGREGENVSCSPTNLYLALAMLAECTGGETRAQILSLLGAPDLEGLRSLANRLFLANYCDDGASKSLLAGALWLREDLDYRPETLKTLAENYYAASFRGEMGSPGYDAQLRQWLREQTGDQLTEQLQGLAFAPDTVLGLTTTVDYANQWLEEFQPKYTLDGIFHARGGDLDCRMMRQDETGAYYWGQSFGAVELLFKDQGSMRFLLPDAGVTPEALLEDAEALSFLLCPNARDWANWKDLVIHLSLPKFDVSSQLDLEQSLQDLGLRLVFDPASADFSPLSAGSEIRLSQVTHGTRVAVDEKGVTAAAYTMMVAGAGEPPAEEMDFTLDRPFLFAVYGPDRLPLFVGVVNQP